MTRGGGDAVSCAPARKHPPARTHLKARPFGARRVCRRHCISSAFIKLQPRALYTLTKRRTRSSTQRPRVPHH